jgi:uncharacterized protein (DUF2141 family)
VEWASDRSVEAALAWVNGRLQVRLLSAPPEKDAVLSIDEDVVLDPAASRLLGYQQVSLKAGQYAVDTATNPNGDVVVNASARGPILWVEIGRRSRDCRGFGICGGGVEWKSSRSVEAALVWVNGRLQMRLLSAPPEKDAVLSIDEDVVLDPAASRLLGYEQVSLKAGQYAVDTATNPNGDVVVNASARGPIIWVEIGRRSRDCRGFGICGGGVEWKSSRSVEAALVWVNGRLQVRLLSAPPEKDAVLSIDENVVLDPAASRLLGYEQVSLKAGQYAVDTATNPNGDVVVNTSARGPIIWVEIGRRSRDCRGFGICGGGVEWKSGRSVEAALAWVNGRLQMRLLSAPPEKDLVLSIDDDVVLDPAASRLLGYEQVSLKAGLYVVDTATNPNGDVVLNASARGPIIWVEIGRKSADCKKFGFCRGGMEWSSDRSVEASFAWVDGRLQVRLLSAPPEKDAVLSIDEDVVLDPVASRLLGYEQVSLKAGQYALNTATNPNGDVVVNASARGPILWVEIGRRSRGCRGFGICGIGVEWPSDRSVEAALAWVNGRLQVRLLSAPPEKDAVLGIDEDVVLDPAASRLLGYQQVSLKAGQYAVDTATNPNGDVVVNTSARGPIIWVEIGRRSAGCLKFGICRAGAFTLTDRSIPASLDWVNGEIFFNFLASPPDKEEVLVIDEDVVMDEATSRLLGHERITLRAGEYPVSFGENPRGTVGVRAQVSDGLTIGLSANGILTIAWPGTGWKLQTAGDLRGPWQDLRSPANSLSFEASGAQRFFRTVRQ